jgi:NTE family protein
MARPARASGPSGAPRRARRYETIDLLRDTAARWKTLRAIRDSTAPADRSKPAFVDAMRVPEAEIYVVDVSFAQVGDAEERDYLNSLPTSFVLPPEAVDRLRAAAGQVLIASPEFRRLLTDVGVRLLPQRTRSGAPAP